MHLDWSLMGMLGFITVGLSLLVKLVGLPNQIIVNFKRKSTQGVSTLNHVIGILAYASWTLYGVLGHDLVVALGQGLGVITEGIIVSQIFMYRKNV